MTDNKQKVSKLKTKDGTSSDEKSGHEFHSTDVSKQKSRKHSHKRKSRGEKKQQKRQKKKTKNDVSSSMSKSKSNEGEKSDVDDYYGDSTYRDKSQFYSKSTDSEYSGSEYYKDSLYYGSEYIGSEYKTGSEYQKELEIYDGAKHKKKEVVADANKNQTVAAADQSHKTPKTKIPSTEPVKNSGLASLYDNYKLFSSAENENQTPVNVDQSQTTKKKSILKKQIDRSAQFSSHDSNKLPRSSYHTESQDNKTKAKESENVNHKLDKVEKSGVGGKLMGKQHDKTNAASTSVIKAGKRPDNYESDKLTKDNDFLHNEGKDYESEYDKYSQKSDSQYYGYSATGTDYYYGTLYKTEDDKYDTSNPDYYETDDVDPYKASEKLDEAYKRSHYSTKTDNYNGTLYKSEKYGETLNDEYTYGKDDYDKQNIYYKSDLINGYDTTKKSHDDKKYKKLKNADFKKKSGKDNDGSLKYEKKPYTSSNGYYDKDVYEVEDEKYKEDKTEENYGKSAYGESQKSDQTNYDKSYQNEENLHRDSMSKPYTERYSVLDTDYVYGKKTGTENHKTPAAPFKASSKLHLLMQSYGLVSYQDVPFQCREPFIIHGYRSYPSKIGYCLRSIFHPTNETLNVWTHFIPLLIMVAHYTDFRRKHLQNEQGLILFPYYFLIFGVLMTFLSSTLAHTFNCCSLTAREYFFCYDYSAIAVHAIGLTSAFTSYICPYNCIIPYTNLSSAFFYLLMIGNVCTVICSGLTRFPNIPHRGCIRIVPYALLLIILVLPCVYKFFIMSDPSCLMAKSVGYDPHNAACGFSTSSYYGQLFVIMLLSFLFAGVVQGAKIPERFLPGTFDFICHSHQLFHIFTFFGLYLQSVIVEENLIKILELYHSSKITPEEINITPTTAFYIPILCIVSTYFIGIRFAILLSKFYVKKKK